MDIIPSDLATYGKDAKSLLKELQSQNERMFMVTFLVLNTGRTEQELENNVFQAQSIAQKHNSSCVVKGTKIAVELVVRPRRISIRFCAKGRLLISPDSC